jgi:hypothetical protein
MASTQAWTGTLDLRRCCGEDAFSSRPATGTELARGGRRRAEAPQDPGWSDTPTAPSQFCSAAWKPGVLLLAEAFKKAM